MSLPESLERAASELAGLADRIRPANGDPHRLLEELAGEDASSLLAWILEHESDSASELVDAWCEEDSGAAIVLGVPDAGLGKAGRKLLRRARHRLRSRGLEVAVAPNPAAPPPPASSRRVVAGEEDWQQTLVSRPDFRGARIAYLADRHPSGGARLFEIRFDDDRGILDFKVYNAGRSKVRGFLRSITSGRADQLFEVERDALCALVRRASLATSSDRPLPTAFVEWRGRLFGDALEGVATPGERARAALGVAQEEGALQSIWSAVASGEIGPWPPPSSWVADRMTRAREAVEGLDGEARVEAIEAWLESVTDDLEAETDAERMAGRLEELAWVRWRAGDEPAAGAALAATEVARAGGADARPLSRARIDALFAPFLEELRVVEEIVGDEASSAEAAR